MCHELWRFLVFKVFENTHLAQLSVIYNWQNNKYISYFMNSRVTNANVLLTINP